jgi:hypothetical protein
MSFQKAHNISNELAEVVVTTGLISLDGWAAASPAYFSMSPTVAGKSYRVLEVGYTVQAYANPATNGVANCFDFGIESDPDAFLRAVPVPTTFATAPAATAAAYGAGTTISTSSGGAETLSFRGAGLGNIDSDGVGFLNPGQVLRVTRTADTAAAQLDVVFFARLAPVVSRDVFA